MNKLIILIKNYLLIFLGELKYKKKTGKMGRFGGSLATVVILGLFLIFIMGSSAAGQIYVYQPFGLAHLGLYNNLLLTLLLSLMLAILRGSMGSSAADAELLLALPLKRQTIIVAKSCSKYLFELWPSLVIFLPALVVYVVIAEAGAAQLLRGLLLFLLIPLLSVGISYILNWLFFKLGSKLKNPQTVTTVLSMVFLAGYLVFTFSLNSGAATAADVSALAERYYAITPLNWGVDFILTGSISGLLLFACLTVLPFIIGVAVYARIFGRSQRTWHSRKKEVDFRQRTPYQALLKKELNRYFGSSAYVVNTAFGMVLLLLLAVVLLIGKDSFMLELIMALGNLFPFILIFIFCFCIATCYTSACSISLEGKSLWILKSLPLSTMDIFRAKLTTNLLVTMPLTFICSLVCALILGLPLRVSVALIVFPLTYCLLTAVLGLIINLLYPKLDWDDEARVIKQSMAAVLALLIGIVPAVVIFVVYFIFLAELMGFFQICLIASVICLLLTAAAWLWLRGKGQRRFEEL